RPRCWATSNATRSSASRISCSIPSCRTSRRSLRTWIVSRPTCVPNSRAPGRARLDDMIAHDEARRLIEAPVAELPELLARAAQARVRKPITFSKKIFVPLTTLCRDYCGYCTFRRDPGEAGAHTMTPDEVVALAQAGARLGAKEALFSLGDKPEALFPSHREFLRRHGHRTTLGYL